jgi:hypothetical protein
MDLSSLERLLWIIHIVLLALLALRLFWSGLFLRYRWFCFLVVLLAGRNLALGMFEANPVVFFYIWLWTEPVVALSYILAIFEIYALALQRYQGLSTFARSIITVSMVVASVISVASIFPDLEFNASQDNQYFLLVNVIRRGLYTSLLGFLVVLVSLISFFPVRLSRNTILHIVLFSTWFLFHTASTLAINFRGKEFVPYVNVAAGLVAVLTGIAWCLLLTPSGEHVETAVRSRLSDEQADILLDKLKSINETLAVSRRRL